MKVTTGRTLVALAMAVILGLAAVYANPSRADTPRLPGGLHKHDTQTSSVGCG